jgi:hypothetical protein
MSLIESYNEVEPPTPKPKISWRENESKKRQISNTYHCSCGARFSGKGHYKIARARADVMGHLLTQGKSWHMETMGDVSLQ